MNELINLIVSKTGLTEEQARKAAEITVGFIKTKLPAPLAGQVDAFLGGANPAQDIGKNIEGLFGRK